MSTDKISRQLTWSAALIVSLHPSFSGPSYDSTLNMLHKNALGLSTIDWREFKDIIQSPKRTARVILKRSDMRRFAVSAKSHLSLFLVLLPSRGELKIFWFAMSSTAPLLISSAPRSVVPIRCRSMTSYNTWHFQRLLVKSPTRYDAGLGQGRPCPRRKERARALSSRTGRHRD
jgi:hypothetical protein